MPQMVGEDYVRGVLATTSVAADIHPQEWSPEIHKIIPAGRAPFAAILMGSGSDVTRSKDFNWWSEPFPEQRGTITAIGTDADAGTAYTSGAIVGTPLYLKMTAADAMQIVRGHTLIMHDETTGSEFVADVTQVTIAGAISIVAIRMQEVDNGDNDLADVDSFWLMSQVMAEGADLPPALMRQPTKFHNHTTITAATVKFTGTELAELERITPDKRARARQDALLRWTIEQEKSALFSKFGSKWVNGEEMRFTRGLIPAIKEYAPANVYNFVTDSGDDFRGETWKAKGHLWLMMKFEELARYQENGGRKTGFIGTQALLAIQIAIEGKGEYKLVTRQAAFGISIVTLVHVYGQIDLILDPLFTTHPARRRSMLIVEFPLIKYRPLRGRDVRFLPDLNEGLNKAGPDMIREGWRGEWGIQYNNLDAFGWFVNMGLKNTETP